MIMFDRKEYGRKARSKARKKGLCPNHPKMSAAPGRLRCQDCLNYLKRRAVKSKKDGVCTIHTKILAVKGKTLCAFCLLRARLWKFRKRGGLSEYEVKRAEKAVKDFRGKCEACGVKHP